MKFSTKYHVYRTQARLYTAKLLPRGCGPEGLREISDRLVNHIELTRDLKSTRLFQ